VGAVTLYDMAERFVGEIHERPGGQDHPWIQWALSLCGYGFDAHDEVPWCSAAVNAWAWMLRRPLSRSAAARSWLLIGEGVALEDAERGWDVVILKRGDGLQPGPEVIAAPGHVGILSDVKDGRVWVIGGNQRDGVTVASFPTALILGIRRV